MGTIKEYTNNDVTITWEAEKCIHSAICVKGLGDVFKPDEKPWIKINAAPTETLVKQVKACPSGALGYFMNDEKSKEAQTFETQVEVLKDGPLLIYGTLKVTYKGGSEETKNKTTAFCRCGASHNKPYCDGTHVKDEFKD